MKRKYPENVECGDFVRAKKTALMMGCPPVAEVRGITIPPRYRKHCILSVDSVDGYCLSINTDHFSGFAKNPHKD